MRADRLAGLLLCGLLLAPPAVADQPYIVGSDDDPDRPIEERDLGPRLVEVSLIRTHVYSERFAVESVAVAPNGREVAAISRVSREGPRAWEIESGRTLQLPPMPPGASALAYSPDVKFMAAAVREDVLGDEPGGIDVYDLDSGRSPPPLRGGSEAHDVVFSPDGRVVVAAVADGVVAWDLQEGRPVRVLDLPSGADSVAFTSADDLMVTVDGGRVLMRVSVSSGRTDESWEGRGGTAACSSPEGRLVAMGGVGVVRIFDLWEGGRPQQIPVDGEVTALDWGSSGDVLAVGTKRGEVLVFSVRGTKPLPRDPGPTRLGGGSSGGGSRRSDRDDRSGDDRGRDDRGRDDRGRDDRGRDGGGDDVGIGLEMGRADRSRGPFGGGGTGTGGDRGGRDDRGTSEPAREEAPRVEIVAEVKLLLLSAVGTDPRTGAELESSLRDNLRKIELCWRREARKGADVAGELVLPMSISADGEGRSFGEPVSNTTGNSDLVECLEEKLRGSLFPPGLGSLEAELTLTLREEVQR